MMKNSLAARITKHAVLIALGVACLAIPAASTTAAADTSGGYDLKITKQGDDKAVFDKNREIFDVCDKESDDHAVYAYFSYDSDKLYYDKQSGGCDRYEQPGPYHAIGIMYVCEDIPGWWDSCSDGVWLETL